MTIPGYNGRRLSTINNTRRGCVQGVQARGTGPGEAQAAHGGGQAHSCLQELGLQVEWALFVMISWQFKQA